MISPPDNYTAGARVRTHHPDDAGADSSGMVLVIVIILSAVAGILAAGLHFAGTSRIAQVRQEIRFDKAFFVAEAGVERAKVELRIRAANLNSVLTNGVLFGGATNYGAGTFRVHVRDNVDSNASLFVDTDYIVIIRSTGIVENAKRVIEAEVRVTPPAPFVPGQSDGALALYGTNATLLTAGNAKIDGRDYDVPADFNCTGGGCSGTVTTNAAEAGVFYTSTTTVINAKTGSLIGNPPLTNGVGMFDELYWYQFLDQLGIESLPIYPGGSLGTRDAPVITLLPSGTTTIEGNVAGAGILIIPGEAMLDIRGTFHYEGLVILIGGGTIDADTDFGGTGTARIFGAMVCLGGAVSIEATGTSDIKYSTAALANLAKLPLPGQLAELDVLYWTEIKASVAN